jgi:hypothetical protein
MATNNAINSQDPIQVALGGTGAATFTANGVMLGNGTSPIDVTAAGTNGQVFLGATSAAPGWVTPTAGSGLSITTNSTTLAYAISAPVSIANGGTNATSMSNTDGVVYYDGTRLVTTTVGTATYVLTSNGSGMAPTFQAPTAAGVSSIAGTANQITASASTGAVTLSTPSTFIAPGSIAATTTVTATSGNITATAGNVVLTSGNVTLTSANSAGTSGLVVLGNGNINLYTSVGSTTRNVYLNDGSALANVGTNDTNNVGIGYLSLANLQNATATYNIGIGTGALQTVYNTSGNVGIGYQALNLCSQSYNVGIGHQALNAVAGSAYNIGLGYQAGTNITGGTGSNIYLNNAGINAETNTLRIGAATGTSTQDLQAAFISGIYGTTNGSTAGVVLIDSSNQLGGYAGTSSQVLVGGTKPSWAQVNLATQVTGVLPAANGGVNSWVDETSSSASMVVSTNYICNKSTLVTLTLPGTAAEGTTFVVVGKGAGGWQIAQASGQSIIFGTIVTTTGTSGYLASSAQYDSVTAVCTVANTTWTVYASVGNITYN